MTPEERATRFWKELDGGMVTANALIINLIRAARLEALEEAAVIAESLSWPVTPPGPHQSSFGVNGAPIAAAIRERAKE